MSFTAEECGVIAWCKKPQTDYIFFNALTGPKIKCTFISYIDTFSEIHELAKEAFIEAFIPTILEKEYFRNQNECNSNGIKVTTHGYGDCYQCFFANVNIPDVIECRILTTDDWHKLSTFEKIIKWACELERLIKNIIIENKVQLCSYQT